MIDIRICIIFFVFISNLSATWFEDIPRTLVQPNGKSLECFITGDQYGRRLHDINNFTIILNQEDGYYYYADQSPAGELIPSNLLAGLGDPRSIGLEPGYAISIELYNRNKEFYLNGVAVKRQEMRLLLAK